MSRCAPCDVTQKAQEDAPCWNCNGPTELVPGDWPGPWSAGASYHYAEPVAQPAT